MQVLLGGVGVAAEIEQAGGAEAEARLLPGLAHRGFARAFAGVDAALGQVPVTLTGDVAEQQLVTFGQHHDAAAEAALA